MDWYYAFGRERQGPVDDEKLNSLVSSGTITDATLVWNKTMTEWTRYGAVKPEGEQELARTTAAGSAPLKQDTAVQAAGSASISLRMCTQCQNMFPEDELAAYGSNLICAGCKPSFLQRVREGVSTGSRVYAGFWIRFAAKFVDGIIITIFNWIIGLGVGFLLMSSVSNNPEDMGAMFLPMAIMYILQFAVNTFYYVWFVGKYAATPGKMVCGLKIITAEDEKVSYWRAFGRMLSEFVSSIILCIGYIMAAFDSEKRALHDRMCSTRVIKK